MKEISTEKVLQEIENSKRQYCIVILGKIGQEPHLLNYILEKMKISEVEFKDKISLKDSDNISFYQDLVCIIKEYVKDNKKCESN